MWKLLAEEKNTANFKKKLGLLGDPKNSKDEKLWNWDCLKKTRIQKIIWRMGVWEIIIIII